jgi:hypothetical protein
VHRTTVNAVSFSVVQCRVCGRTNRVLAVSTGVPRCGNCGAPLPWITDADDNTFAEMVEASAVPALVDLWAPLCGPCRTVSPTLEQRRRRVPRRPRRPLRSTLNLNQQQTGRRLTGWGARTLKVRSSSLCEGLSRWPTPLPSVRKRHARRHARALNVRGEVA